MKDETNNVMPQRPADASLRDLLHAITSTDRRLTQAQISRELGVSASAFNQWTKGVYAGDNSAIESKLRVWIDGRRARHAAGETMPAAPEWLATPTSGRIIKALSYAQMAGDISVIYGSAGLGKTTSIHHYTAMSLNVWHVTMTPASAGVVAALEEICLTLGLAEFGGAAKLFRAIVRRIRGTNGLLVIDEAQHLSVAALDQIRSIYDATNIGIALVGNTEVYARMTGGNRAAYLDRLYSRIGKRVALTTCSDADIVTLIDAWSIADTKCKATLFEIARGPGALRTLTKVLRLASMNSIALKKPLCCEQINKAWRELGGET